MPLLKKTKKQWGGPAFFQSKKVSGSIYTLTHALDYLLANRSKLTPAEQSRVMQLMRVQARGFRSNWLIDKLRPNLWPGHPKDNPKQRLFLSLDCLEAMYGGAAGGGKTDALLIAALQYVDEPGYSAMLLRNTTTNLTLPGAIMHRCIEWMRPFTQDGHVRFSGQEKSFYFSTRWMPHHIAKQRKLLEGAGEKTSHLSDKVVLSSLGEPQPAQLSFGYCETSGDVYRYNSAEYQFIGWDELREQTREDDYRFMFSRARRKEWMEIPIRIRAATNPGRDWVRDRFITEEYINADKEQRFSRLWVKRSECDDCGGSGVLPDVHGRNEPCVYCSGTGHFERYFVPAIMQENPSLDVNSYRRNMKDLPAIERARMENGDWTASASGGLFFESMLRWYRRSGTHIVLQKPDARDVVREIGTVQVFLTVDTASKEKTTSDYTVISVWALDSDYNLALLHAHREKMEVPKIVPAVLNAYRQFNAVFVIIEDASSGVGVIQSLRSNAGQGVNVKGYHPGVGDKVSRSTVAQIRCESGQVFFPAERPRWCEDFISEMLGFPQKGNHDDCVDTLTMACWYASGQHNMTKAGANALPSQVTPPVVGALGQGVGGALSAGYTGGGYGRFAGGGIVPSPSMGSKFR